MTFFRTTVEAYSQLQPAIDEADRNQPEGVKSYILSGHCLRILPEQPTIGTDGSALLAVPDWMLTIPGASNWINHPAIEQIERETYDALIPQTENDL